ncbi:hypothetical protein [Natronorubrum sp. DTA7]|uniref:hypothetical protein n=1 Tax=Natronorubrum sp. DTA7 TaxID=3447016 RepID=UPI003F86518E
MVALLVVSTGYTLIRKPLASAGEWLLERAPDHVVSAVPDRCLAMIDEERDARTD